MASYAEALTDNGDLTLFQHLVQNIVQFKGHRLVIYLSVSTAVISAGHHVKHTVIFAVLERSVNTYVVTVSLHGLADLVLVNRSGFCQL